jgi:hypothetical protein
VVNEPHLQYLPFFISRSAANCTPKYGLFDKVLSFGLALSMAFFSASANFAAFKNSALAQVDLHAPVGTAAQPFSLATYAMYSLDVAHAMNFCAASAFWVPAGTAKAHVRNRFAPFCVAL